MVVLKNSKTQTEIVQRAIYDVRKLLEDIWADLATENPINKKEVNLAKDLSGIILKKTDDPQIKYIFLKLKKALKSPTRNGDVISDILKKLK